MKRLKTLTLLFVMCAASSAKSQYVGANSGLDQFFGRNGVENYGITIGYEFAINVRAELLYSIYGSNIFEKHKLGFQAKYALPLGQKENFNILAGAGTTIHFGGKYPTKKIQFGWPGSPFVCSKERAATMYGLIGLELRFGNWSIPLEFKAGRQNVFGNDIHDSDLACPAGFETNDVSKLVFGGVSVGLVYQF